MAIGVPFLLALAIGIGVMAWAETMGVASPMGIPPLLAQFLPGWSIVALGAVAYFAIFITFGVMRHVFLTLPLLHHYAETLCVTGISHLPTINQRDRDAFQEAEGIAEALDVGAAI